MGFGKGFLDYRDVLDLLVLSLTEEYFFFVLPNANYENEEKNKIKTIECSVVKQITLLSNRFFNCYISRFNERFFNNF